jgi:hypothetical protein
VVAMSESDSTGDDSLYGDSVYESGVEDAEDFDPIESLTGSDQEEPLDTSYSPPDYRPAATRHGLTDLEQAEGESLDERLAEEEPEIDATADPAGDYDADYTEADPRSGRLVAPDEGAHDDTEKDEVAFDAGTAGYAASAEEAAVHVVDEDEAFDSVLESDDIDEEDDEFAAEDVDG